ncbi:hypothetical protein DB346_21555 [Verrucomicrobia bacterium LW23]|nr:hypothetical protein DB346_21555 [Verrucomicrobia bacterium LW23]
MSVKRVKSKTSRQRATGQTPAGARTRMATGEIVTSEVSRKVVKRKASASYLQFNGDYTLPLVALFVAFWSIVGIWYLIPGGAGLTPGDRAEAFARENPRAEVWNMEEEAAEARANSSLPISPRASSAPSTTSRLPVSGAPGASLRTESAEPKKKAQP